MRKRWCPMETISAKKMCIRDREWKAEQLDNIATLSKGIGISKEQLSEDGAQMCIRDRPRIMLPFGDKCCHFQGNVFIHLANEIYLHTND